MIEVNTVEEDKSADLLSAEPKSDLMPTGGDRVGSGGEREFLMQAWQALAMYIAATEEPAMAEAGMKLLTDLRKVMTGEGLADQMENEEEVDPNDPNAQDPNAAPGDPNAQKKEGEEDPNAPKALANPLGDPNAAPAAPAAPATEDPRKKKPAKKAAPKKRQSFAAAFACEMCDRGFASDQGLVSHLKNVHRES